MKHRSTLPEPGLDGTAVLSGHVHPEMDAVEVEPPRDDHASSPHGKYGTTAACMAPRSHWSRGCRRDVHGRLVGQVDVGQLQEPARVAAGGAHTRRPDAPLKLDRAINLVRRSRTRFLSFELPASVLFVARSSCGKNAELEDQAESDDRESRAHRGGAAHLDDPAEQDEHRTDDVPAVGVWSRWSNAPRLYWYSERPRQPPSLRHTSSPTFVPSVRPAATSPGSSVPRSTPCVAARAACPANGRPVNAESTSFAA